MSSGGGQYSGSIMRMRQEMQQKKKKHYIFFLKRAAMSGANTAECQYCRSLSQIHQMTLLHKTLLLVGDGTKLEFSSTDVPDPLMISFERTFHDSAESGMTNTLSLVLLNAH